MPLWACLCFSRKKTEVGLPLLRSSPLLHQVFFFLGSTTGCSTTTLCESGGFTREASFKMLQRFRNHSRWISWCSDTWDLHSDANLCCYALWSEEFFHMPGHKFLGLCNCVGASRTLSCESAQLPSCSHDRDFGLRPLSPLCCTTQCVAFFSRSCATRSCRNCCTTVFSTCCKMNFVGVAETPRRESPLALIFSEVIASAAWAISNVLATATELFRFFGSPPAFPVCLNAH